MVPEWLVVEKYAWDDNVVVYTPSQKEFLEVSSAFKRMSYAEEAGGLSFTNPLLFAMAYSVAQKAIYDVLNESYEDVIQGESDLSVWSQNVPREHFLCWLPGGDIIRIDAVMLCGKIEAAVMELECLHERNFEVSRFSGFGFVECL